MDTTTDPAEVAAACMTALGFTRPPTDGETRSIERAMSHRGWTPRQIEIKAGVAGRHDDPELIWTDTIRTLLATTAPREPAVQAPSQPRQRRDAVTGADGTVRTRERADLRPLPHQGGLDPSEGWGRSDYVHAKILEAKAACARAAARAEARRRTAVAVLDPDDRIDPDGADDLGPPTPRPIDPH